MAYTYDDFVNAANAAGGLGQFGQNDLTAAQQHPEYGLSLLSLQRDYGKANNESQKMLIEEAQKKLRKSFGVQEETPVQQTQQSGFQWDAANDPAYQAYRKEYMRNANRATGDALGQYSAATGGRASSYAVNAATQAGDYYATQLSDMVPTMYQNAYERYMTEQENAKNLADDNYSKLTNLIGTTGYEATDEELGAAGMTREQANAIKQNWIASNPQQAYAQGVITPEQFYSLTGKWPAGYSRGGTGSGSATLGPSAKGILSNMKKIYAGGSYVGNYADAVVTSLKKAAQEGQITYQEAAEIAKQMDGVIGSKK